MSDHTEAKAAAERLVGFHDAMATNEAYQQLIAPHDAMDYGHWKAGLSQFSPQEDAVIVSRAYLEAEENLAKVRMMFWPVLGPEPECWMFNFSGDDCRTLRDLLK